MERTWQLESASLQESSGFMLTENLPDTAADRRGRGISTTQRAFFAMQRTVGNRAVQRMVEAFQGQDQSPSHTPDSAPNDEMRMAQPTCTCGESCSACQSQQRPDLKTALATKPSGKRLMPALQEDMEEQFGEDFSGVHIHSDARAREMTQEFHADALTAGNDIFFNAGQYDPTSYRGRRILAHELAHVVQQARGWRPSRAAISVGDPDDRYEREAGRIAEQVAQRTPPPTTHEWYGRRREGGQVEVQERWHGPDLPVSRIAPGAAAGKGTPRPPATGLTTAQNGCIKRIYEKAMGTPRDGKWKRCYVTAQAATCGVPRLLNIAAAQPTLDEAVAPVDWELYLADPKGLACQAPGRQTPEVCCEETRPQPEPRRREAPRLTRR